jgi:aspartokinase-like uncharacterized kinase
MNGPCLVKLGGSLLDLPDLLPRLRHHLDGLAPRPLALLVGGGPTTDAVRTLDRVHNLGEMIAHDLALRGLTLNTHALAYLLGKGRIAGNRAEVTAAWAGAQLALLDPWSLLHTLEAEAGEPLLPHTWEATSDSVALVLAAQLGASELHLLKSVGPPGPLNVGGVHPHDVVDPCFVDLWRRWPSLRVEVVPFRLDVGQAF